MKELGETIIYGAEGVCENSQAKGPFLDDTLENDSAPKKQFSARDMCSRGESFR